MRILVVKLADLGDLLLSEPAIRSLRTAFPTATIDVLTTPHAAGLLPLLGHDTRAISFEKASFDSPGMAALGSAQSAARLAAHLRLAHYDRVVLLHHLTTAWGAAKYRAFARATGAPIIAGLDNGRGGFLSHAAVDRGFGHKHESAYMLDVAIAAGGMVTSPQPRVALIPETLPFDLPDRYVALAPSAGRYSAARIWPAKRFARLASRLARERLPLVIAGGTDAAEAARRIVDAVEPKLTLDLTSQTTHNQLGHILARAALVVSNDSFPAHLAAAVGAPVLTIFGPSNVAAWAPVSDRAIALSAHLPCAPCLYTGYRLGRRAGCPARTCLTMVTAEMAFEKSMELLGA